MLHLIDVQLPPESDRLRRRHIHRNQEVLQESFLNQKISFFEKEGGKRGCYA